jgi:CelD/BcsL family acetyltransferase involved in cellulose biosynthesis
VEEEAAFWDTHDFTDFAKEWTPVQLTVSRELAERLTLRLEQADRQALAKYAREKGIGPSTPARMWLKERLRREAAVEPGSR